MRGSLESKEATGESDSCFSTKSLIAVPSDHNSLMLDQLHFIDENYEKDLLLDAPSDNSFTQAELLHPSGDVRS